MQHQGYALAWAHRQSASMLHAGRAATRDTVQLHLQATFHRQKHVQAAAAQVPHACEPHKCDTGVSRALPAAPPSMSQTPHTSAALQLDRRAALAAGGSLLLPLPLGVPQAWASEPGSDPIRPGDGSGVLEGGQPSGASTPASTPAGAARKRAPRPLAPRVPKAKLTGGLSVSKVCGPGWGTGDQLGGQAWCRESSTGWLCGRVKGKHPWGGIGWDSARGRVQRLSLPQFPLVSWLQPCCSCVCHTCTTAAGNQGLLAA